MRWKANKNWGTLLLGIWLIASGAAAFVQITFRNVGLVLSLLAIVAGVLILLGR